MRKREKPTYGYGEPDGHTSLSLGHRMAIVVAVLVLLTAGTWALTFVMDNDYPPPPAGTGDEAATDPSGTSPEGDAESDEGDGTAEGAGGVPEVTDPVEFAEAFADLLWSYDARTTSRAERVARVRAWMTDEEEYADWDSIASQIPSAELWAGLEENDQRAAADIEGGRFASAFLQAVQDDPGVLTEAYVYVVTVSGRQTITWAEGGRGEESRSVTLAIQCRPDQACRVSGRLPGVAP